MKNTRGFFRKSSFTLLEIIVAMGVFSLLMAMTMQFFSGAQRIWSSSESRNTVYSDARVAMDLMATLLQSTYYKENETPFIIVENKTTSPADRDAIYFATKSPLRPRGNTSLFFASFQVDGDNELLIATICDKDGATYRNLFFPSAASYENIADSMYANLNTYAGQKDADGALEAKATMIIPNITSFKISPGIYNYHNTPEIQWNQHDKSSGGVTYYPYVPALVRIELGILPAPYYERWLNASGSEKTDILKEQEKKFTRIVFIGDRN